MGITDHRILQSIEKEGEHQWEIIADGEGCVVTIDSTLASWSSGCDSGSRPHSRCGHSGPSGSLVSACWRPALSFLVPVLGSGAKLTTDSGPQKPW